MKSRIIWAVFRREFVDMLRDRRALIATVAVPLLMFPLLLSFVSFFLTQAMKSAESKAISLAVGRSPLPADIQAAIARAHLKPMEVNDVAQAVRAGSASCGLIVGRQNTSFTILEEGTSLSSGKAATALRSELNTLKQSMILNRLRSAGLNEEALEPIRIERQSVSSDTKMGGFFLGSVAGYIVILVMFSNCAGIAVDLTVGEKQRRTMESLVTSPAPRKSLALGKALVCIAAAFWTGVFTTLSLYYSFTNKSINIPGMKQLVNPPPMDPGILSLLALTLFCFACFAASLVFAIASASRSSREAQSYLSPLVGLTLFPALLGGLPGIEISATLSLIPILNVSQLMKSLIQGEVPLVPFAISCGSNLVYAAVCIWMSVRNFESERITLRV